VDGTGAALVEAGRITGMIGGYVLLVQILLMSRVGWLAAMPWGTRVLSSGDSAPRASQKAQGPSRLGAQR
jgi:hypothetical protein